MHRFSDETFAKCTTYVLENGITTGCNQSYNKLHTRRFDTFETRLTHGNNTFEKKFTLKEKGIFLKDMVNIYGGKTQANLDSVKRGILSVMPEA